jgi:hypothetical protein
VLKFQKKPGTEKKKKNKKKKKKKKMPRSRTFEGKRFEAPGDPVFVDLARAYAPLRSGLAPAAKQPQDDKISRLFLRFCTFRPGMLRAALSAVSSGARGARHVNLDRCSTDGVAMREVADVLCRGLPPLAPACDPEIVERETVFGADDSSGALAADHRAGAAPLLLRRSSRRRSQQASDQKQNLTEQDDTSPCTIRGLTIEGVATPVRSPGDAGALVLAQAIARGGSLESLDLVSAALTAEGMWLLATGLVLARRNHRLRLTSLVVRYSSLKPGGGIAVAHAIRAGCLRHLNLGACSIGDDGARAIAAAITDQHQQNRQNRQNQQPQLHHHQDKNPRSRHENGLVFLESLELGGNDITWVGAVALADALANSRGRFHALDLSWNPIEDRGALALAEAIAGSGGGPGGGGGGGGGGGSGGTLSSRSREGGPLPPQLQLTRLSFSGCKVGGPVLHTLVSALCDGTRSQRLCSLRICTLALNNAGGRQLAALLVQSTTLRELSFEGRHLSPPVLTEIVVALAANTSVTHFQCTGVNMELVASGFALGATLFPLAPAQRLALAMGGHPRLGRESGILRLPREVVRRISTQYAVRPVQRVARGTRVEVAKN